MKELHKHPLIITIVLATIALLIGAALMQATKSYVDSINDKDEYVDAKVTIDIKELNDPLKVLQIRYITGEISKEEYLSEEEKLLE